MNIDEICRIAFFLISFRRNVHFYDLFDEQWLNRQMRHVRACLCRGARTTAPSVRFRMSDVFAQIKNLINVTLAYALQLMTSSRSPASRTDQPKDGDCSRR